MQKLSDTTSAIARARRDSTITEAEVGKIIKSAGKTVSNAEAKVIGALFESRIENYPPIPGARIPMATPHNPHVGFEANQAFNQFFVSRNLPFGGRADSMRDQINSFLQVARLGRPLEVKPNVGHLTRLPLQPAMMDGPSQNALVDVRKNVFFLEQTPGGNLPPGTPRPKTQYWGPFALPKPELKITPERGEVLQAKFDAQKNGATWNAFNPARDPKNVSFELESDGLYKYTAIVSPPAGKDPNGVNSFMVMRFPLVIPANVRIAPEYSGPFLVDPRDV